MLFEHAEVALAVVDLAGQGVDLAGREIVLGLAGEAVLVGEIAREVGQQGVQLARRA